MAHTNNEREYNNDQIKANRLEGIAGKLEKATQDPKQIDLNGIKKAIKELYDYAWKTRTAHDPS